MNFEVGAKVSIVEQDSLGVHVRRYLVRQVWENEIVAADSRIEFTYGGWRFHRSEEGITWARGWDGAEVDALKALVAL